MSLYDTILSDLKNAMKAKEKDRLRVLRSLKAALLEKEISERKGGQAKLTDEQIVQVLTKAAKQRKESIEQFERAGRDDLVENEKVELAIIEEYLPEMMSEDKVAELIDEVIAQVGASSPQDMGKVMGVIMPKVKGKADGSMVNKIVRQKLSNG
ncbi:MAG TPA: GatB/YqeY domain-containing protein [Balneolales bacterium]|nr:GatB/YqeY domain-containing protein [Balneolales bacterium]